MLKDGKAFSAVDRRRYHFVNWKEVKKSLWQGGLGIRSLVEMNRALHGKWIWRYLTGEDRLWRRVVEARWGSWSGNGWWGGRVGLMTVSCGEAFVWAAVNWLNA